MVKELWLLSKVKFSEKGFQTTNIGIYSTIDKAKDYCNNAYFDEDITWYEAYSTLHRGESRNCLFTITFYILDEFNYD